MRRIKDATGLGAFILALIVSISSGGCSRSDDSGAPSTSAAGAGGSGGLGGGSAGALPTAGAAGAQSGGAYAGGSGGEAGSAGAPATSYVSLMPGADAWLVAADTELGLQGPWYTFESADSTITASYSDAEICAQGTAAQVLGDPPEWGTYYGSVLSFDVCQTGATGDPPETKYALGSCPFAPNALEELVGLRFRVSGTVPDDFRVVFQEAGRAESTYVNVTGPGEVIALFEDASVGYNSGAPPIDATKIESVNFHVATKTSGPTPFDFCITGLEAIVGAAPDTSGVPDWVREPGPGMRVELSGVNLAGAEFGENLPGTYNSDYTYPTTAEVDYFTGKGMNVFRIPFRWERLQQTLNGPLDLDELERLAAIVESATLAGATVVLDPHNYARYGGQLIGSAEVPNEAFADFWARLAAEFRDNPRVAFGLVNEPHDLGEHGTENWLASANAAIAAIREAGASNLVLVPGNGWTGAASWSSSYYGTPNADVMGGVIDPADNFVFEVHQYLDANASGAGSECVSESIGVERLAAFTSWLRENGFRGFLGEFGGYPTPTCFRALDGMLAYMGDNADVWLGWSWWAAGPWWGNYALSIEPTGGTEDKPHMLMLARHLTAP